MKPSSPLYYNAADIMAAFSRAGEPDGPAAAAAREGDLRILPAFAALSASLAGPVTDALRALRSWRAGPALRVTLSNRGAAIGRPEPRGALFSGDGAERCPPLHRPGLSSHYALAAPFDHA